MPKLTNAQIRAVLDKATALAATAITGATNATPISVTSTAHGLQTSDKVAVYNVGGNTAANGYFAVTRVDANTFTLDGSSGNGAFTAGGSVKRIRCDLKPNDLYDLLDALSRVRSVRCIHSPGVEDLLDTIFPFGGPNP